ncbi:MAG: Uma2 family endonuclease [Methylobacteriaceae bacterium]|nr:Uma2 family endonuclease [Methylobacteriaceae bacterium]
MLLAIEVANATLTKDRGLKASVCAKYGVRELWVIDPPRNPRASRSCRWKKDEGRRQEGQ